MKFQVCVLVLSCNFYVVFGSAGYFVSGRDGALLPAIFNMTKVETCPLGYQYCKLLVQLKPQDEQRPSELWKSIVKVNEQERDIYRRDVIYRTVCVERAALGRKYYEYSDAGLDGWIDDSYCFQNASFENIKPHDVFLGLGILFYMAFLVYCTIKTKESKQSDDKPSRPDVNKYIKIFSIPNIWREIRKQNKSEDFTKLQSIQGFRAITMVFVVVAHNYIAMVASFSYNPEYIEQLVSNSYTRLIANSFGLIVQIFFAVSAWLLSIQLNNIVTKNGKITIKDVLVVALNRYFRIIPAVLLVICFHSSPAIEANVAQLLYRSLIHLEKVRCTNGWWMNVLFIQNWTCFGGQICNPGTWYLAVDTQLYMMTLLLFYLSHKLKISMNYFLGAAAAIAMSVQGYTVMTSSFDGLIQFTPRMMPAEAAFSYPEFIYSYIRTENSLVTFVIGFVFGSIYVENKHKDIFNTPMKKVYWFAAFFGLTTITTLLYDYRPWRIVEVIMAVTFRPLYALGVAIGILGMATNTGGYIKRFFEWRPFVFMGTFTYSVYMFQFSMIYLRMSTSTSMTYFSSLFHVTYVVQDVILSILAGIVMHIIVEHPCGKLQKIILPQVKTRESKEKNS